MNYGKGWGDPTKYGVAHGWKFVGPNRERKQYFYLRCKECGGEQSFVKYQLQTTRMTVLRSFSSVFGALCKITERQLK